MSVQTVPEAIVMVTEALEGGAVEKWRRLLAEAVELRPARLVVDLHRCPRIDAAAIVLLLQVHRDVVRTAGRLTVRSPVRRVRRTLSLGRVDHILDIEELRTVPTTLNKR